MRYIASERCLELPVEELCRLAYRSGDEGERVPSLLSRDATGLNPTSAPASDPSSDTDTPRRREHVYLSFEEAADMYDATLRICGRTEAITHEEDGSFTVEARAAHTRSGVPTRADRAALCCYGYLLCRQEQVPSVRLQLIMNDEECVNTVLSVERLQAVYLSLLEHAWNAVRDRLHRETEVREAAKEAAFPYSTIRDSQADMIKECWRDLRKGQLVFAQAPTGIGKTISTLYPAVRCWGERRCDKIFYLTAKSSIRREVCTAVERLNASGTPVRACIIAARDSVCDFEEARTAAGSVSRFCKSGECSRLSGYHHRVEAALQELLQAEAPYVFTVPRIRAAAAAHGVCPYELSLDLSEHCEIVLCDYNYVFSPHVYLRRYFEDGIPHTNGHRYVFLVDEAHNLADRAREMYSAALHRSELVAVQSALASYEGVTDGPWDMDATDKGADLYAQDLDGLLEALSEVARICENSLVTESDGVRRGAGLSRDRLTAPDKEVDILLKKCDRWLFWHRHHPLYGNVERLSESLRNYRTAVSCYDKQFVTFVDVEGDDVRVRLMCLDPSSVLRPILDKAVGGILFSATLTPADYFATILGGGERAVTVEFPSPFDRENLCLAVVDSISTRYEDREDSCRRIVSMIAATVAAKRGNYMVYCPSYAYLEKVHALFTKRYPKVRTVVQSPNMTSAQRDAFIEAFRPDNTGRLVGFCVMGGLFSEGVDLPGRALIGAVIIGVGMPGISNERNVMKEFYDEMTEGEGYAYAYVYPGMNRVLQAAGRVIRRDEDRGIVVLIDDRYAGEPYLHLYPEHWSGMYAVGDADSLAEVASRFWQSHPSDT